jgi:putative inorganic carbon (hco3(-)) transporter
LGSFLTAALVMLCAIFVRQQKKQLWIFSFSVIVLFGLVISFSRSAWLGLIIGIGWLAWDVVYRKGEATEKKLFRKILFVLGVAGIIFTFLLKDVVFPRFDSAVIEREQSVSERETTWREAILLIREHPFAGVGAGNYTTALIQKYPNTPVYVIQPAHNVFLLMGAELGLIGLILFISLMYKIFAKIFSGDAKVHVSSALFLAAFITLAPGLFVDHFLWSSHFGLLFFFLLAGLLMNRSEDE